MIPRLALENEYTPCGGIFMAGLRYTFCSPVPATPDRHPATLLSQTTW